MKSIRLTEQALQAINPKSIVYAEFSEPGAMGDCGTTRIFTLEKDQLHFYLINVFEHKSDEALYGKVQVFLNGLVASGILWHEYAAFGNHAYKSPKLKFTRDDTNATFIYETRGQSYKIPASCNGVYFHVVAKFAEREVTIDELKSFFRETEFKTDGDEAWFFEQYFEQIIRNDSGQGWFDFTPLDYYNAVRYLRHISGEDYLLSDQEVGRCWSAIYKYRLSYVVDKIGWSKLDKIIAEMVKAGEINLAERLKKVLHENIWDIYGTLETIKPACAEPRTIGIDDLEHLFKQPVLVDFDKSTHRKIIQSIIERPGNSFNPDAGPIACYLANYLLNEDKLALVDVIPAVAHIVEVMPDDDFNHTHTDELFSLCGDIIDRAWRYLEDDGEAQKKYRDLIYELYWPRVGSLWPVIYRDKFEFKHESAGKIFDDALEFVMCLDDIADRNLEVKTFLDQNAEHVGYNAGPLGRCASVYTLRGLKPQQEFEKILETVEPDHLDSFLSYPDGIEEAEILLTELFRADDGARITGRARLATFEALLINPNAMKVGEYILNYLDANFSTFAKIIWVDCHNLGVENPDHTLPQADNIFTPIDLNVLTDFFIAMSKGISEENEFAPLKSIQQKLEKLGCDKEKLANAMKHARRHRRAILFQRSALRKIF